MVWKGFYISRLSVLAISPFWAPNIQQINYADFDDSTYDRTSSAEGEVGLATWWLAAIFNRSESLLAGSWHFFLLLILFFLLRLFFLLWWSLLGCLRLSFAAESIIVISIASSEGEVGVSTWHLSAILDGGETLHIHRLGVVVTASLHF